MEIVDDYRPGALAGVVALHAAYYSRHWNFGLPFEAKVAAELAAFLSRMDPDRDLFLTAWEGPELLGSVTVDVSGGGARGAHLRWFVTGDSARGKGLGRALLARAVAHCEDRGVASMWLTTFAGLDAARHLYDALGFRLAEEAERDQWQGGVREQLFLRDMAAAARWTTAR